MKIIKIGAVWCPACLIMHKTWTNIQKKYPDLELINYDYDIDNDIVTEYNIGKTLPVIIFFKNNQEYKRLIGEKKEQEIIDIINELE